MITLINLETGDIIEADRYNLIELGEPEGYRIASSITTDEWVSNYCSIIKKLNNLKELKIPEGYKALNITTHKISGKLL